MIGGINCLCMMGVSLLAVWRVDTILDISVTFDCCVVNFTVILGIVTGACFFSIYIVDLKHARP